MEGAISDIRKFASDWHQHGAWNVGQLPALIGAHVEYIPGGGRVLGQSFTSNGLTTIVLNEDLVGTPLHLPILAHECAHCLLGHEWIHECVTFAPQSMGEQRAWVGGSLLAIPQHAIERLAVGECFPQDLAYQYSVPEELVELRFAMLKRSSTSALTRSVRIAQTERFIRWLTAQANPAT